MEETLIDKLRKKLIQLQKDREGAVMEKGLAAQENNDLRENFAYDYWEMQERIITARIHALIKDIEDEYKKAKTA